MHRFLIVLDDDDRVSDITQVFHRLDEAGIVFLVETDRWLIKDIEHALERGADLRGETDALRLPAR